MTQEIAIVKQENIQTIVSATPQSYQDNKLSRERCIEAGQAILDAIQAQGGMTDVLDQQAAQYIEKARKTVKKMNERRAPVTQLFDTIRKEFTSMENDIDPTKVDTIPYKLQQCRNQFAAKKRAEEEERRRKEYERQQAEAARIKMRQDIEDDFRQQFYALLNKSNNALTNIDNAVTLDNYESTYNAIKEFSVIIPDGWLEGLRTSIRIPVGISIDEVLQAEASVRNQLAQYFAQTYECQIETARLYILDRLPSKKANLERMAQASADEAARIKAEMEARQRKEAEEQEAERRRKEEEEKQKAEMARQQAEMGNLFNQQAAVQGYEPKIKVMKKIKLLNPEGIMPVILMWWNNEGCKMTTEELAKIFKKQITFCEKLANKDDVLISHESVKYIDDVKAK